MEYVYANENGKKFFKIPVEWSVYSTIAVQADTLEEAIAYVAKHAADIPIDSDECEYLDESYKVAGVELSDLNNQTLKAALDEQYGGALEEWDAE